MKKILTIILVLILSLGITSCEKEDYKIKKEVGLKCLNEAGTLDSQKELLKVAPGLGYTEQWAIGMRLTSYLRYCFDREGLEFELGISDDDNDDGYIMDELLHGHYTEELDFNGIFGVYFIKKKKEYMNLKEK